MRPFARICLSQAGKFGLPPRIDSSGRSGDGMKIRDRLPLLAVLCCFFRTAAVAGGQRTGGAGRDAALRADAYPVAVSVFRALVAAHRLRRVGAALCAFVAADAAAVRSFRVRARRHWRWPLRRLPLSARGQLPSLWKTVCCRETRASGCSPSATTRGRVPARRVRRGRVFVQPRGRGAVPHPRRRGALCRAAHLPRVAAGTAWNISAQKRKSAASFHSLSRGGAERADGMPQCERVRRVFHGACAAVAALSAGGLRLIAPPARCCLDF